MRSRLAAACAALALTAACSSAPAQEAPIEGVLKPPAQPTSGPGGSDYPHGDFTVTEGGEGHDAWFVFQPADPVPDDAPLAIMTHGYYEYAGYQQIAAMVEHTVRQGAVVIYPRWQTDVADPCPGPYDIEPCMDSVVAGITGGLDFLASDDATVSPRLDETSYFGFSFGGILTTNMANRHSDLPIPEPKAIFIEDPHSGATDEHPVDDDLSGIPATTWFECHSGATGIIGEAGKVGASCNAIFPKLGHLPADRKALVMTRDDWSASPPLASTHGVCAGPGNDPYEWEVNAYDWNFCWKVWDALREAVSTGEPPVAAIADSPEHRSLGEWSNGRPVEELVVLKDGALEP